MRRAHTGSVRTDSKTTLLGLHIGAAARNTRRLRRIALRATGTFWCKTQSILFFLRHFRLAPASVTDEHVRSVCFAYAIPIARVARPPIGVSVFFVARNTQRSPLRSIVFDCQQPTAGTWSFSRIALLDVACPAPLTPLWAVDRYSVPPAVNTRLHRRSSPSHVAVSALFFVIRPCQFHCAPFPITYTSHCLCRFVALTLGAEKTSFAFAETYFRLRVNLE